jgi:putative ABC transport system substrate-binding protein
MSLFGAVAAAWPLAARAQQREQMRRIGVLLPAAADDAVFQTRLAVFLRGLQQLGWTDGRNVRIDTRWAAGDADLIRKYAGELVALGPDVVMAFTSAAVPPLQQVTRAIPIVFAIVADPVGAGYVESLARPGGNVTGFTAFEYALGGKWRCGKSSVIESAADENCSRRVPQSDTPIVINTLTLPLLRGVTEKGSLARSFFPIRCAGQGI